MSQAMSISLLALVTALGGVVGTQLGRDAISEIDPILLSGKPDPMTYYPDDSSTSYQLGPSSSAQSYGSWGYYYWARGPVCWGCPEREDKYVEPFVDPLDAPIPTSGRATVRMVGEEVPTDEAREPLPSSQVERYASFPVTQDEARRLAHIVELQRGEESAALDAAGASVQPVGM